MEWPVAAYTEVGVGYAWAHLNHELFGFAGTRPALLTDSHGYTAETTLSLGHRF
jgi:hypothetical protein